MKWKQNLPSIVELIHRRVSSQSSERSHLQEIINHIIINQSINQSRTNQSPHTIIPRLMKQKMEGESILHEENIPIIRQRNPLSFSSHSRRSYFGTTSCIRKLSSLILILWLLVESVEAQGPACSCTPTVYRWRINFDGTCPPNNVQSGPGTGLSGVSCDISTINSPITNITYVQILELGPTLAQVLKAETSRDIALNDTVIEFSSVTSALPSVYAVGLQFFARANTESSGTVELQWIVSFSNICEKTVFQNGNSLGWLTFVSIIHPYIYIYLHH